jgi:hypothetical protein
VGSERSQRVLLEPNLAWFIATFPKDGQTPLAKVYLALIAVDRGDTARAVALVQSAKVGQSGTTRDLAELVEGALLLRRQASGQAFERFLPLVGKLIDPYARLLLDEQIVTAAIAARRWYEAVAYMDLWLRDAQEEDATPIRAQVKRALEAIPSEALELMMKAMQSDSAGPGYGVEIRKAVVARLAAVAIDQQDTELARRLVESTGGNQALGEAAEGVEELASSGGAPTVDGRTIGLLVSTGQSQLGGHAAEVLTGVVDALRLAGGGGSPDHVRLTTRDERDTKRTELALLALASQGASVLIAGLDPSQAQIAASFAERTHIPVILLSALHDGRVPSPPAFVLGEASDKVLLALAESLAGHGARTVAPVGGAVPPMGGKLTFLEPASCSAPPNQAGESRFPVSEWRSAKVDYLLLLGDASCTVEAIRDAASGGLGSVRAAVGLDAADIAAEPSRVPLLLATAGMFPLKRGDATSAMSGFKKRHGRAPSWFAAMGHDAAVLARAALRALPIDRADDSIEVEKRHRLARDALGRADAELWSTDARGFAGQNAVSREIGVVEVK